MFESLKKKLFSWIGKKEEKPKKVEKKKIKLFKEKKEKVKAETPKNIRKQPDTLTKEEKQEIQKAEQIIKEAETPLSIPSSSQESSGSLAESAEEEGKGNFFTKLLKKITSSKLSQEDFDSAFQDLEITLLENNVALEAVDAIKEKLSKELTGLQMKKTEAPARIFQALKDSILSILQEPPSLIEQISSSPSPYVIVFFGINGTGKTTSIAKLSHFLKKSNISTLLAAGDTFRAASIEQLKAHAEKLQVPCISSQYNADPASVAFDAIAYAKKHSIKVVLIDTAGRMYTKANLMKEMEKIIRISKPNLKIFVGESITGNDAIDQAKTFNESIGIDGIILSKADIDEKAGTVLSVSHVTGRPIYFLGTGQSYDDLSPFTKKYVLKNLGLE